MQKYSLSKLAFLYVITLGFYEYVWLARTYKQISASDPGPTPSLRKLFSIDFSMLIVMASLGVVLVYLIPHLNNQLDTIKPPSQQCMIAYGENSGNVSQNGSLSLTPGCKGTVDRYYDAHDSADKRMTVTIILACLLFLLLLIPAYLHDTWYRDFAKAISRVISNEYSPTSILLGINNAPLVSMLLLQKTFNQMGENLNGADLMQTYTQRISSNNNLPVPNTVGAPKRLSYYLIGYVVITFVVAWVAALLFTLFFHHK